jgi:hypothetical protein
MVGSEMLRRSSRSCIGAGSKQRGASAPAWKHSMILAARLKSCSSLREPGFSMPLRHLKSQPMHRRILPKRDYTVRVSREYSCEGAGRGH